jgi:Helix-turn-helix domain
MGANSNGRPKAYINPYKLFVGSFVPNWLLRRKEVSPGAKLCYARLCQYAGQAGEAFPYQESLAEELGVSLRQAQEYLKELQQHRLIESRQRGFQQSNVYRFLNHTWITESVVPETQDTAGQETRDPAVPLKSEENHLKGESLSDRPARRPETDSFNSFWIEHPKKVKKAAARRAWKKLRPNGELSAKIIAAVKQQRASPQWLREDGRFIPDPHKWLEGRQWEDELPDPGPVITLTDIRRHIKERKENENA